MLLKIILPDGTVRLLGTATALYLIGVKASLARPQAVTSFRYSVDEGSEGAFTFANAFQSKRVTVKLGSRHISAGGLISKASVSVVCEELEEKFEYMLAFQARVQVMYVAEDGREQPFVAVINSEKEELVIEINS